MRDVEVADVEAQTVDIDFPATGIAGVVVDEATGSARSARASVSARPEGRGSRRAGSDDRRRRPVHPRLAPGEFTLQRHRRRVRGGDDVRSPSATTAPPTSGSPCRAAAPSGAGSWTPRAGPVAGVQGMALRSGHPDAGTSIHSALRRAVRVPRPWTAGAYVLSGGSALAGFGSVADVSPGGEDVGPRLRPGRPHPRAGAGVDGAPVAERLRPRPPRGRRAVRVHCGSAARTRRGRNDRDRRARGSGRDRSAQGAAGRRRARWRAPGEAAEIEVVLAEPVPPPS